MLLPSPLLGSEHAACAGHRQDAISAATMAI